MKNVTLAERLNEDEIDWDVKNEEGRVDESSKIIHWFWQILPRKFGRLNPTVIMFRSCLPPLVYKGPRKS